MKVFLITHKASSSSMLFTYTAKGVLKEFKLNFSPKINFYSLLTPAFPFNLSDVDNYKGDKAYKVAEIAQDLTFTTFWNSFAYKHGNKQRASKLWSLLPELEKAKALAYIPTYKNMLINSSKDHLYPETYLKQKRYDNE
ncbi:hypothetical protein PL373_01345 [Tenacibaculum maritimum]|nr:hypothetical protein [Tenacibaculum maritimum]MDB0599817.1 hypothetical protein [Tenacibaculum maritimum]MDB0610927.1 hypothetical protein [Tenacibaculum maritimum]